MGAWCPVVGSSPAVLMSLCAPASAIQLRTPAPSLLPLSGSLPDQSTPFVLRRRLPVAVLRASRNIGHALLGRCRRASPSAPRRSFDNHRQCRDRRPTLLAD